MTSPASSTTDAPGIDRLQNGIDAGIALCLGLIPAFHLVALQLALVLIILSVALRGRDVFSNLPPLGWPEILILQFAIYFLFNACAYPSLEGNMRHFQRIALESWGMTLLGFGLTWIYLAEGRDFLVALQRWTPIGLAISFFVMSYFFFGPQGSRAQAFSTNTLVPPMWYLTLTLICFCNFAQMSKNAQITRLLLLGSAAVMCFYSGGRMILIIWLISTLVLASHLLMTRRESPSLVRSFAGLLLGTIGLLALFYALDILTGRTITMRFIYTYDNLTEVGLSSSAFFRLDIWAASLEVIRDYLPFGAGQVNERFLIHQIIERDWWFRAHQTYLSYLIAGGWIALVSGLLFQGAAFALFTRALFPAGLGMVLVPGLNGLTDSVFQSFFSVQLYMLLVLLLVHSKKHSAVHPKEQTIVSHVDP